MKRKIACITGTRADYPRVRSVLKEINSRQTLELDIIVTGSHLLQDYGYSAQEIIDDGFSISKEVEMFIGDFDTPLGMAQASARCTSGVAQVLSEINPDLVLLTVDRVETLASATAASLMNFPIAHIQGGEVTGTIDESIRHAVTKLSHIHFPATFDAAQRIINMGENKEYVFNTGCPYIDEINNLIPLDLNLLGEKKSSYCHERQVSMTSELKKSSFYKKDGNVERFHRWLLTKNPELSTATYLHQYLCLLSSLQNHTTLIKSPFFFRPSEKNFENFGRRSRKCLATDILSSH